jgi:hypothetical protein
MVKVEELRRWMSLQVAGRYAEMSRSTLQKLHDRGLLNFYKPTNERKILVDKSELDAVIKAGVVN